MPLTVVPTPIGNLEDMTLRGLRMLREADIIACEDTRRTIKLLNYYDIHKPLISYHQHNERSRTEDLLTRVEAGESVVLVSDAGTPCISDPGGVVVRAALERGLTVDVLPGANALLPALVLSGLDSEIFTFAGFLEGRAKERSKALLALEESSATLIFYVAPHNLISELLFFKENLGDRRAAIIREISKIHQEALRGSFSELLDVARTRDLKGEMVLVVEGRATLPEDSAADAEVWQLLAVKMRDEGIFDREIANVLFSAYGIPRNAVKTFLLREVRR